MSQLIPPKIVDLLEGIVDSIPSNYLDNLRPKERKNLEIFLDNMGIPIKYVNIVRKLTALLILNRLRFIVQNENNERFKNYSMSSMSSILEKKYPKIFIPSILSKIASNSEFVISSELYSYKDIFDEHHKWLFSTLYENALEQKFRRKMGQFWTPEYISEFMIKLILQKKPRNILDPCCGPGTFIQTLNWIAPNYPGKTSEIEIHPLLFEIACVNAYPYTQRNEFIYGNFLTNEIDDYNNSIENYPTSPKSINLDSYLGNNKTRGFDGIICNPPYSRHHVLQPKWKKEIGEEIENIFGGKFNRLSSLFVYFVLKALTFLGKEGRMVFITPTIAFESRNSAYLKEILKNHYSIPIIIVFHQSLNIFQGVDTAACIFVVEGMKPTKNSQTKLMVIKKWISTQKDVLNMLARQDDTVKWNNGEIYTTKQSDLDPERNWTSPRIVLNKRRNKKLIELSQFFKVMRGIATGNNSFFTFTEEELKQYKIKRKFVVPTITKTRYIQKNLLSEKDFNQMKKDGKKVWLLNLQNSIDEIKDEELVNYLKYGQDLKVHKGSLVKTRKNWYTTEKRDVPTFLYTYLSRGNPRFIYNLAKVRPLNTFLMLYPHNKLKFTNEDLILFWIILNSENAKNSLRDIGRCYGGETLKIEPKEMMTLQIINPFRISSRNKEELLTIANQLENINYNKLIERKELFTQVDRILEKELEYD